MATILIIGSTGMLGSAVAKLLDSTNHVIVESNTTGNSLIQSNNCIKQKEKMKQEKWKRNPILILRHQSHLSRCQEKMEKQAMMIS